MRDKLYFFSILFQIRGLGTASRAIADLSWNRNVRLGITSTILLATVLAVELVNVSIYLFYMVHRLSRLFTILLHCSEIYKVAMMLIILLTFGEKPKNPTNSYYAAILTIIYSVLALSCKASDLCLNGSSVNQNRLTTAEKSVLIAFFYNFLVMIVGAIIFRFVEGWAFTDSWNFINVTALTIGYGDMYPRTLTGKILIVILGNAFVITAGYVVVTVKELMTPSQARQKRNVILFTFILIIYTIFGTMVFMFLEDWAFIDSLYFVWYTLTTVGYGNIVPKRAISWEFWLIYVYISVALYGFGLGLVTNSVSDIVHAHAQNGFSHTRVDRSGG